MFKNSLLLGLLTVLFVVPFATNAEEFSFPEGKPLALPESQVLGASESLTPEEKRREMLMQTIALLRLQLAALLEKYAVPMPQNGEVKSYSVGSEIGENSDLKFQFSNKSIGRYGYDGTDIDDDSWYFAVIAKVTNKNQDKDLILDRESLFVTPVDENRRAVTPKRTFNFKTGIEVTTSAYGYDKNDHKMIAIEPGQTANILVYHPYQFSKPGKYRGLLKELKYTFDSVEYDKDTDQFKKGSRVYELDTDELKTFPVNKVTLMVEPTFVDERTEDDKYNFKLFDESDYPFTFSYPEEFAAVEDDGVWTISHEGQPYIVLGHKGDDILPDVGKEVGDEATALNRSRVQKKTWLYNEDGLSGTVIKFTELSDEEFNMVLYDYSDTSESFTRYPAQEIVTETFVTK